MLCHSISITQIISLLFIINIIYIHVSMPVCLSICVVWSDMVASQSSEQSDVKWQVVRLPSCLEDGGMLVISEEPSCSVCWCLLV